jgi:DNA-binding Lrp family transcriptional regulator
VGSKSATNWASAGALGGAGLAAALRADGRASLAWIAVAPAHLVEAAERIAAVPEAAFVAAVSGAHNLHVAVACRSAAALYEFLTREVGGLPGVSAVETVPVARRVKLAGSVMHGELLPEPV